jgi:hypothetical protein
MRTSITRPSVAVSLLLLLAACAAAPPDERLGEGESAVLVGGIGGTSSTGGVIGPPAPTFADNTFTVRALGNRCVDFGGQAFWAVGAPVMIYGCNGTVAQQVRVKELDATHDVELRVQGLYCIGVRGGRVAAGLPLELQACNGSPGQRFAFDGDAIMMGYQRSGRVTREVVIEPDADGTAQRTPLVVGTQEASPAEYFRMQAVDGSGASPTIGFVKVATEAALDRALTFGWGTVIELDDRASITLTGATTKLLHEGTTLRGYRSGTYQGPEVIYPAMPTGGFTLFDVSEDHVRITGFRLRGGSRDTSSHPDVYAMTLHDGHDILVDHIDGSDWTTAFINVLGSDFADLQVCGTTFPAYPRPTPIRAIGNFIHHNTADGAGYGFVVGQGAFALARGNVMYMNRHSVAADGWGTTGYAAQDNFVLSDAPGYGFFGNNYEQDFDKHGTLDPGHWNDGLSDDYVDIGWNTFLGANRYNVDERGTPCRFTAIHDNVFRQAQSNAIRSRTTVPVRLSIYADQFGAPDPTGDLAVGDFDGDHIDDVFVGTGTGWWFSSGGQAEWRFLNRMPEHASSLRFGDFDNDGRTDVLALHGGNLDVSWAGVSAWQTINVVGWALSDLAVGDFDGDHYADLFLATGSTWFYAPGGRNWQVFASSSYRTPQLRFGDFTGDGKTDVLGVVANQWQIVRGGGSFWEPLRSALTPTLDGLVVADFDGDGFADVARQYGSTWQYAARGWGGFVTLRNTADALVGSPVGRFDGDAKSDVLVWSGLHWAIAPAARDPLAILSRQDMR